MRILIADDEEDIRDILALCLAPLGHDIQVECDGAAAYASALARTPDLVLLDWMMPHATGIEVCRWLRRRAEFTYTGIFVMSARGQSADRQQALDAGATDYVIKPFSVRSIASIVSSYSAFGPVDERIGLTACRT